MNHLTASRLQFVPAALAVAQVLCIPWRLQEVIIFQDLVAEVVLLLLLLQLCKALAGLCYLLDRACKPGSYRTSWVFCSAAQCALAYFICSIELAKVRHIASAGLQGNLHCCCSSAKRSLASAICSTELANLQHAASIWRVCWQGDEVSTAAGALIHV